MSQGPGPIVLGIVATLTEYETMTAQDLARELDMLDRRVSSTLSRMRRVTPMCPRRVHICAWVFETEDPAERRYPRAVYALGDKPDAKKPKVNRAAVAKKYQARNRNQVASAFHLALPARARRATFNIKGIK